MNKFFGPFRKVHWLHSAGVMVIMAAIVLMLRLIGLSIAIFDPLGSAIDDFHFSDGYFYAHQRGDSVFANPNVAIVDIAGCRSRAEIANVLEKVAEANPVVVGLDVIFAPSSAIDRAGDDSLLQAISHLPGLVTACNVFDGGEEHSFFAEFVSEGNVSLPYDIVRSYSSDKGSFVGEILRSFGREDLLEESTRLIDFSEVKTWKYGKDDPIPAAEVQDCIVLVGDTGDLRDYHRVPVKVNGKLRLSGVELYAQQLYTSLQGKRYSEVPVWINTAICLLLIWLFCALFICRIFDADMSFNGLRCLLAQIFAIMVFFAIGFAMFFGLGIYFPPVMFLVGAGLAGLAAELFYCISRKCFLR